LCSTYFITAAPIREITVLSDFYSTFAATAGGSGITLPPSKFSFSQINSFAVIIKVFKAKKITAMPVVKASPQMMFLEFSRIAVVSNIFWIFVFVTLVSMSLSNNSR
jgi:hypothetical protein